jgi:hypothetical protein
VPNTRGEREVIERRNIRETPANSGTVTFSVQASNLRQAHTGELTKTAQVRVIKPGTPVFDVQPRVASVSKNTQLMFRIHSPTHDKPGNPATYRFFMRQDTNPQEATVGGFITDKGEAVRYWGIQSETPANLGVVRFYATVGDFTVGPIYVTVTP